MPDKDRTTGEPTEPAQEEPAALSQPVQNAPTSRTELLTRARSFLTSPQVQLQHSDAKRAFLAEKGLTPSEVDQLLRELPPSVPPRTYPAPPPSNLPNLLIGAARIFTWLTGTSALILLIYYRYLLPRLAQSYQARLALRKHQFALITRLTDFASVLKTMQAESYKDLPRPVPVYEDPRYTHYHSLDDLLLHAGSSRKESTQSGVDIPDITILRCALEELSGSKTEGIVAEELFRYLEGKLVWLGREESATRQCDLWNQLNSCPLFESSIPKPCATTPLPRDHQSQLLWKYVPPLPPPMPPLLTGLAGLRTALLSSKNAVVASSGGQPPTSTISARQRALQALSDFTGYITTQTYSLGLPSTRGSNGVASRANLVEEELRREIRALKGLVLNRRSFLPYSTGAFGFTDDPP